MKRFVFLVIFLMPALAAYSQTEDIKPAAEDIGAETKVQSYVDVKDSLLSVELYEAEFGGVMKEIAKKAGFEVSINSSVYGKKLSTSFKDLMMEKGILRLLTLIREKNYSIFYHPTGLIREVRISGGQTTVSPVSKKPVPLRPVKTTPLKTVPTKQEPTDKTTAMPEDTGLSPEEIEEIESMMDETYPYMPPKEEPVYIPPAR